MNYKQHVAACLTVAVFTSIFGYQTGRLTLEGLKDLWAGVIPYTLIITCDLDSLKSTVRRLWGPFKFIWKPFVNAGHREILHNPIWGPYILISFLWIPLTLAGYEVRIESIYGAVLMLETHIVVDKISSFDTWIVKKVKKVF